MIEWYVNFMITDEVGALKKEEINDLLAYFVNDIWDYAGARVVRLRIVNYDAPSYRLPR